MPLRHYIAGMNLATHIDTTYLMDITAHLPQDSIYVVDCSVYCSLISSLQNLSIS